MIQKGNPVMKRRIKAKKLTGRKIYRVKIGGGGQYRKSSSQKKGFYSS
jgi:hypothetical protein